MATLTSTLEETRLKRIFNFLYQNKLTLKHILNYFRGGNFRFTDSFNSVPLKIDFLKTMT